MRSLFEIACERCNSNDGNSACEAVVGELRATLLRLAAISPRVADSPPARGGNCTTRGSDTPVTRSKRASCSANPPLLPAWRASEAPEGLVGLAAVPWAVAGPGWAIHSDPAPLVWRAPEGPEGTGGLRGAAPNEVRSPSLAGGRGLRRPEHPWGHKATQQDTAGARSASAPRAPRVSVAHRLSWMLRPGTASISSRV